MISTKRVLKLALKYYSINSKGAMINEMAIIINKNANNEYKRG